MLRNSLVNTVAKTTRPKPKMSLINTPGGTRNRSISPQESREKGESVVSSAAQGPDSSIPDAQWEMVAAAWLLLPCPAC